ncbi:MAG TPA: SMI1/KNR4 family protein [Ktedonobacteraceae bacterium]|nr:SMI1/KNR4 family protein [Ktedonobacteraceae bacterium]
MDENYEALFQRIRVRCQQQRWHGPDISNPFKIVEQMRKRNIAIGIVQQVRKTDVPRQKWTNVVRTHSTHFWYDGNGKQYAINEDTDLDNFPLQKEFEYPPATEEQLAATETALGPSLPPLLRALYTNVANGGFGPGYGLERVGFSRTSEGQEGDRERDEELVDLATYTQQYSSLDRIEIPFGMWPTNLFTLCHWGCAIFSFLDCASGRVFWEEAGEDAYIFHNQAASLYEWLDLWADGVDFWARMYPGVQKDE